MNRSVTNNRGQNSGQYNTAILRHKKFTQFHSISLIMSRIVDSKNINAKNGVTGKNNKRQNQLILLRLFAKFLIVYMLAATMCDVGNPQNSLSVEAQEIDCTAGFLCDFFRRFPHLPFSKLHPQNSGFIRTLDYMISKDKDVVPKIHYPASVEDHANYYQRELSEIRDTPLIRIVTASDLPTVTQQSIGRNYKSKVNVL